jgi:hypothetical protein
MKTTSPAAIRALKTSILRLALAALVVLCPLSYAQNAPYQPGTDQYEQLSPEVIDELVGPFALYPDPLIALILPASTVPSDLTLASRYLARGGTDFDNQSWDDSVISLARYPEVVIWMDENLAWTTAVGSAFVAQPVDVMNSIQRLREAAAVAGNLNDTPQQNVVSEVVEEVTYIRIVPAQPELIYVPYYDPGVVYYERGPDFFGNVISFGAGFALGSWLNYDCDWGRRGIYRGDYYSGWNQNQNWGGGGGNRVQNNTEVNVTNVINTSANQWQPNEQSQQQLSRRRDNYNQQVRAANKEMKADRRNNDGKPARGGRKIKALPQPDPIVADGKKGKNRGQQADGNTVSDPTRDSATKAAGRDARKASGTVATSPGAIPTDAPDRKGKNKKTAGEDVTPVVNMQKRKTEVAPSPGSAPEVKGSMKKNDKAAKKSDSGDKKKEATQGDAPQAGKQKKSPAAKPSIRPSAPPSVSGSIKTPSKASSKSQSKGNAPAKIKSPRPSEAQPQQKKSQRKASSQPQQKKIDRSSAPQPTKQKAPERKVEKQNKRSAPSSQKQPAKVRENKPQKTQSQASKQNKQSKPQSAPKAKNKEKQKSSQSSSKNKSSDEDKKSKKNK